MSDPFASREPDQIALETALGSLQPTRSRIDRDRVLYRAGQASARPRRKLPGWPALAASLALVAIGEAALLARQPPDRVVERVVVIHEPAPAPDPVAVVRPPEPRASVSVGLGLTARDRRAGQILRYGLDGLPQASTPTWSAAGPGLAPPRQRLRDELKALALGDPS